ncbi:2TM domain-containing protein [Allomuricauda sp. SCSIO 65647]|uniref:2TM domain-containing protein n=1 Tax=Allomuricauda sp. SCSIO 65647 TaxID=2908843 RepID=UPI001F43D597|nr:2TM domain-containing protein [Muricauda sp. SCSIO 65647]UJH69236.1 2TM domain-containing protein [Muricauda sp. SCSIO 65647]
MIQYIIKLLGIAIIIGLGVALVFIGLEALMGRDVNFNILLLKEVGYYVFYSIVLTLVNSIYFDYLNDKVKWKRYAKYRIPISGLGGVIITMLSIFWIRIVIYIGFEGKDWDSFIAGEKAIFYVVALLITLVVTVIFHAARFYKNWQENRVKEQKIIAGTASAKFDALKNQLDPHFLFNSLNVLTSLIEEDTRQAQRFTTSLSKVYRYVLEQKNKDLVTVNEELRFARTYVQLLKMRFEDSITFDIPEEAKNPEAKIVPLSLQLLLENAVKHNVVSSTRPLKIKVFEEDGQLVVSNNLQEKQVVKKSSGVGLQNIRQRYGILTDREVYIQKSNTEFTVALPMLTKQLSVMETQQSFLQEKRYLKAKEKVEAIKGFYSNLIAYCFVIPFLWWLNFRTTDFLWAFFPTIGWGFGVIAHGMEAYGYNPLWGKRWEERKIRELMEKDEF